MTTIPENAVEAVPPAAAGKWSGAYRRYDLAKEFTIALVVMALLTLGLAIVFSSPDERSISLAEWADKAPNDFVATAVAELDGTSTTASYGAPYNDASEGQKMGPVALQKWAGVREPVNAAQDFVITPLKTVNGDSELSSALSTYDSASPDQRTKWATDYGDALSKAPDNDPARVTGDFGPVPVMTNRLLAIARSGGLDGQLLAEGGFYQTNYTKPLLFLADGTYLEDRARAEHLGGDQWGMMNETGRYPGQAWLWLYTFWYQVPPFTTSLQENADAFIWALMMLLSLLLVLVPFIPGLRSIPRWVPVHRIIWRDYYRRYGRRQRG